MIEPITAVAIFTGISASGVMSSITESCIYDVLKHITVKSPTALQERIKNSRASGELPTNHTIERGLRLAAINATHVVFSSIDPDDLAALLHSEFQASGQARRLTKTCRTALKSINSNLENLRNLYQHNGWEDAHRQKRLSAVLNRLNVPLEQIPQDKDAIQVALSSVLQTSGTGDSNALGALMLEVSLQLAKTEHAIADQIRTVLKRRFVRYTQEETPEFQICFPLFFAQELKDDPKLNAVLIHQRMDWDAEKIDCLKEDLNEFRTEAIDQADKLMHAMLSQNQQLNTLVGQQSRTARALSSILSATWLLDGDSRTDFNDMFRSPANSVSQNETSDDHVLQLHYSNQDDYFIGRKEHLRRIEEEFLKHDGTIKTEDDAYRWMVISGEAGTGKSRLAQEVIHRNRGTYRLSGFASKDLLEKSRFGRHNQERIKHPILIVVDYTVVHQDKLPEFMKGWADYARHAANHGGPPVRIILLMRRPDDQVLDDIRSLGGNLADRLIRDGEVFVETDRMELKKLSGKDTIKLMQARIHRTAERNDSEPIDEVGNGEKLLAKLRRFDQEQRPLFALMVAHAMQRGSLPGDNQEIDQETARVKLFSSYLKGQLYNWRARSGESSNLPEKADEIVIPHANLMRTVTACGGASREEVLAHLRSLPDQDEAMSERLPSPKLRDANKVRDQLVVSMAGGRGKMEGKIVDPIPTLEPDLIGECFVLMTSNDFGFKQTWWCDTQEVIALAWRINPEQTAKFIRRMAQDYPERIHAVQWFPVQTREE